MYATSTIDLSLEYIQPMFTFSFVFSLFQFIRKYPASRRKLENTHNHTHLELPRL